MSQKLPKDAFHLTPRLNILGKGEQTEDKKLLPDPDPVENDVEMSKKLIASLPLAIRTRRDIAIDYMNPEDTLPAFVQTEDENPPFDFSTLTLLMPSDDIAKQSISLLQTSRANFLKEENKYNTSWPENETALPEGAPSQAELQALIERNINMQLQESLDQTSSL